MFEKIQIGQVNKEEKRVLQADSATAYGSGLVEVFATPAMIAFMERTSMNCVQELLPEGYTTVGTHIDVSHSKATPMEMSVFCEVKILTVDGRKIVFKVTAFDDDGEIGSGTHTRFIIDKNKFMKKLVK